MSNVAPFIITPKFAIVNSDLCAVGESMGYDWNTICDWLQEADLQGSDGSGFFIISQKPVKSYRSEVNNIFNKIFEDNPECKELYVMDDF